jgi:GTPase SAR1 family protein
VRKMLQGTKLILELYQKDEFKPFIIQGDHGYGKSSYANSLIADVYGNVFNGGVPLWKPRFTKNIQEWFESHIGFQPKEVIDEWQYKGKREEWLNDRFGEYTPPDSKIKRVLNDWQYPDKKRDYVYHWDDSGAFLHNLDFQDPFVKETGKYMQLVRSDWACVIFSAISAEDITSKIRGLRNAIIIDIIKDSNERQPYRRIAEAYILRRSYKGRVWKDYLFRDNFNCHVPDDFYAWYHPLRDKYAEIFKKRMREKLDRNKELQDFISE